MDYKKKLSDCTLEDFARVITMAIHSSKRHNIGLTNKEIAENVISVVDAIIGESQRQDRAIQISKNVLNDSVLQKKKGRKKLTPDMIPEGYNYAGVDPKGQAWAYKIRPKIGPDGWGLLPGGEAFFIGLDFDVENWEFSLLAK